MKFFSRLKFILLLINVALVFCGFLFISNVFKKTFDFSKNDTVVSKKSSIEDTLIDELSECKNNLFLTKNELERLKFVPDTRQDIIRLLLVIHDIEKKIGVKTNFSMDCVTIFSLASRIPIIQEFVFPYKEQMFKKNCDFANNEKIIQMILPFQIKSLETRQNAKHAKGKKYEQFLDEIKYQISKLFVKSKIQKSDLEIAVENYKYDDALKILIENDFEKNDEFNRLYDAISALKNFQQMINGIYNILQKKE